MIPNSLHTSFHATQMVMESHISYLHNSHANYMVLATFGNVAIHFMCFNQGVGFSTAGSKFLSIMHRARMVSTRENEIYTGSGLRGLIPYI
jgi:hypothetical protein